MDKSYVLNLALAQVYFAFRFVVHLFLRKTYSYSLTIKFITQQMLKPGSEKLWEGELHSTLTVLTVSQFVGQTNYYSIPEPLLEKHE